MGDDRPPLILELPEKPRRPVWKRRLLILASLLFVGFLAYRWEVAHHPDYVSRPHEGWHHQVVVAPFSRVPDRHRSGFDHFQEWCGRCHGDWGQGNNVHGPPLIHFYYRPSRLPDADIRKAITSGAPAHHWRFGDMPPVKGLPETAVPEIIGFVRWLQTQHGID